MIARLAFGIVTSGSTLRTLQDDQEGGTDLNDLNQALWRGYGVTLPTGFLRPDQLKDLLAKGYGAVIQGEYGKIPRGLRLQKDFLGGHAIYLDGYYPGNPDKGIPEAYYVIDPLGHPHSGYEGDWWPASVVDDFATAFGGGTHIPAMWAYPPGGVPPQVKDPHVEPIPHGGGPAATPARARARRRPRPRASSPATARRPRRPWTRRSTATRCSAARSSSRSSRSASSTHHRRGARPASPATFQFDPGDACSRCHPGRR